MPPATTAACPSLHHVPARGEALSSPLQQRARPALLAAGSALLVPRPALLAARRAAPLPPPIPSPRRARSALLAALACLALLPLAATPARAQSPNRGFNVFIAGFDDINGNGKLDCGEPVTVEAGYFDSPQDSTGAITGHLTSPYSGTAGLSFLHGTVQQDFSLSAGSCLGTITGGNGQSDVEADMDFNCGPPSANPVQGNAIVWKYKALFVGSSPSLTATAHGTTSDGLDRTPSVTKTDQFGTVCSGGGPSVTVTKTASGSGAPGSVIVYTLGVTDTSGLGLGGVQFTDVVPDQTSFDAAASSAGWSCPATTSGSLCTLPIGNVPPNGTVTRFFAVDIASPLPAGVTSIANTGCARQGPSLVLGCASATLPTTGAPVLKLAKSVQSGNGTPGATLVYRLVVSNSGNQGSGPVTVGETVPANTSWNAGASAAGWSCSGAAAGSTCTLPLGNVPAGGSVSTLFAVTIANPLPAGVTSVTNTACVSGTPTCGSVTTPTNGMPALSVHKSLSGTATPGAILTYTVAVQNTGNQGAPPLGVSDQVPQLTTFQPAVSSPGWSCAPDASAGSLCTNRLAVLPAGATATLTFAVKVLNPLPAGATTIANTACAAVLSLEAATQTCDTVTTPTQGHPRLILAKQYTGGPVLPGAVLPFTLHLSNTGDQDAGPVTLQETVPAHGTFDAAASTPGWTCTATTPGSTCTLALPGLAAGATRQAVFAVTADASLPPAVVIDNAACATTSGGVSACANAATPPALSTDTTLTVTPAAVSIVGGVAHPTDTLQYALVVPNTETASLTGLVATLTLDPHETLVAGSVTTDHGTVTTGNAPADTTVVVAIGDLPPGQVATISFACKIASGLPPGTTVLSAQALTTGTNIPSDASDDPTTPQVDDPTSVQVTVTAGPAPPIPTLDAWGLLLLCTALAAAALAIQRRRRAAGAATPGPFVP
jgi:uncharacterized repeat protein (TIGR01451 family)